MATALVEATRVAFRMNSRLLFVDTCELYPVAGTLSVNLEV